MLFKKETGSTIIDYLIDISINRAKELILDGKLSLNEIYEEVGFTSYNYFSRIFKKRTGYSPPQYSGLII